MHGTFARGELTDTSPVPEHRSTSPSSTSARQETTVKHPFAGPLAGIRVIDAGLFVAGPFAASLLGDYGADVVKIERPGAGDPLRGLGRQKDGVPLWWTACNRNKRTIALDLSAAADRDTFLALVAVADVVVANFVPGALERLGLGYDVLSKANPRMVMLQVSGFGQNGPYAGWAATARNSEAFSGLTHLTGYPDRPPLEISAFPLSDYVAGTFGAFAVMSALRERDTVSGKGQLVDLGLHEGLFRMMEHACINYDQLGALSQRAGGVHEHAFPVGIWTCADGVQISVSVGVDVMAKRLLTLMGRADLAEDPRFASNALRAKNRSVLDPVITEWFASRSGAEAMRVLGDGGIAAAPLMTMDAIFKDPQYAARGDLIEIDDERLGKVVLPGVIPKLSRTPGEVRHAAHALDADRQSIIDDWLT
jgi:formyl-CoA transferase